MLRKFGQFFLLLSIILISLFYASDVAGETNFELFYAWLGVTAGAFFLLRRGRRDRERPRRFRTLRKLSRRSDAPGDEEDSP
ncbi:MAG: hypothetical protein OEV06_03805 [Anaerolineae bacterium]|nr:hypothetical protein [Anaerolineae bacterium]